MGKPIQRIIAMLALGCFSFSSHAANPTLVNDSAVKTKWGYKGNIVPERWSQLDPSFALCATGKMQSPINISNTTHKAENNLSLMYQLAPMEIMDDGETELIIGNQKLIINEGHGIQLNFNDAQASETIKLAGETYQLKEFHFHSPSENRLQGQSFPMEIHFVHQGKDGKAVAIGVFVKAGVENQTLQAIIDNLPKDEGVAHQIKGERINPGDLFPESKSYYSFVGSLTTPPCSENLQWVVMADAITASPAQILLLRQAADGDNARSVQPLNQRRILFSAEEI